jgi:hypothetical protein
MSPAARGATLPAYEAFVRRGPDLLAALPGIADAAALCCWCAGPEGLDADAPLMCHGQVLLRVLRDGAAPAAPEAG